MHLMEPKYLFGDNDLAARRLELLARWFADSTRAFLAAAANLRPGAAIDLGCGPGFTTHLIANTLRFDRVIGLDTARHFIELARTTANQRVSFALHDVSALPLPGAPADLIFCRFLLTHLKDPARMVAKWATQLNPGGLIMVEETEAIRTRHPLFASYLAIVEAMLASRSNSLYAGPIVAAIESRSGLRTLRSETRRVTVSNAAAGNMFVMNLQAWKETDFIRTNYPPDTIRELEAGLDEIAHDPSPVSDIEWSMRQATFHA
jgi:trans-aconitate 2-methyltransferase